MKKVNKKVIVLALVATLIVAVMYIVSMMGTREETNTDPTQIDSSLDSSADNPSGIFDDSPTDCSAEDTTESSSESLENEKFIVTFLDPDNRVLLVTEVEPGGAAVPPEKPTMPQGCVFSYWDADFSYVTEDMSVYAICEHVGNQENVLALSGGYVQQGENVVLSLRLCGDVCICAFDIRIIYDQSMLEFVGFQAQDGAVDANCMEGTGVLCLNFVSMENTVGEVDLVDLVFTASGESGQTDITIEVVEMIAYDADYDFCESVYTVVPGTVTVAAP